jgi:hypothetical protein
MKITRDIIEMKLASFSIPQGQCDTKAFEIVGVLFNQDIKPFTAARYSSLSDTLLEISNALTKKKIVILWFDTGPIVPSNQKNRALHCYFVFQDNPLKSFTIWSTPGIEFREDAFTKDKIIETITLFGVIKLHVVPYN